MLVCVRLVVRRAGGHGFGSRVLTAADDGAVVHDDGIRHGRVVAVAQRILDELGQAIAHAHDRGVLHLDLKPDNVMIDAQGHVRVLDFGIAQPRMAEPNGAVARPASPAATPAYASCERLIQEQPDVRDDIFSFSCLAYELLAGTHPFDRCSALNARKDGALRSSGIGLTFCKLAVEAHEGRIGVDSAEGRGSTFWFELPIGA